MGNCYSWDKSVDTSLNSTYHYIWSDCHSYLHHIRVWLPCRIELVFYFLSKVELEEGEVIKEDEEVER